MKSKLSKKEREFLDSVRRGYSKPCEQLRNEKIIRTLRDNINQFIATEPSADQMLIWQQNFEVLLGEDDG
jgi:hypothetical protein